MRFMILFLVSLAALGQGPAVQRLADSPGVSARVASIEAQAAALETRTDALRKALPSTPPAVIERADLVAPGRLRLYSSPIRFERRDTAIP